MHACVRSGKQKYAPIYIYIYFWMKTFLKTGVYIYIYIYIYIYKKKCLITDWLGRFPDKKEELKKQSKSSLVYLNYIRIII